MTRRLTVTESRRRCCSPCFLSKQSNVFFFLFSQGKKDKGENIFVCLDQSNSVIILSSTCCILEQLNIIWN
ncbi:hypothetical protein H8957_006552, partial [Semnopithecus entellus]